MADPLLGDEPRSVLPFRLALLASQDLLRAKELDGLPVDRLVEGDGPEDALSLLLAPGTKLGRERLILLTIFGEMEMEHQVTADHVSAVNGETGLEGFGLEERMCRLRLPEG